MWKVSWFCIICISLWSCKDEGSAHQGTHSNSKTEIIKIYNAIQDGSGYKHGDLLYVEKNIWNKGQKSETHYLNPDNSLKGKEIQKFIGNDTLSSGADYFDSTGKLLSYYRFIYDNSGKKTSSEAFDGSTNEVLRFEKYTYDHNGFLASKTIVDQNFYPSRKYVFTNDFYGNVTEMFILNENQDTIGKETYKIMQYDDEKQWLEKWGFVNDTPKTYYQRVFEPLK